MATSRLTVLAGPTAVGKGTVVQTLRFQHPKLVVSVSATTRAPRPGEIDGIHYYFPSDSQFDELVEDGGMLERAKVHELHRYGTLRHPVEEALAAGRSMLLGIDSGDARQVRRSMSEAHFAFLAPSSWDVLVARLLGRGTEDEEERARRLEAAETELAAKSEFGVTVTNDDLDVAVMELARVMDLK